MAPLVLPAYSTIRIKSPLDLPAGPGGSRSKPSAAETGNDASNPSTARETVKKKRFMGTSCPHLDAWPAEKIYASFSERCPPSGTGHRSDVRGGGDDVVVPLLAHAVRVGPDVEREAEAVDLEGRDVAQPQVLEVGLEHAVEPEGDPAVALAGRVRLDHVFVAV